MENKPFTTIDEYIALFPAPVQEIMQTLRKVIKEAAPDATEKITWEMPTFFLHGNLVHFAGFKKHIGFYPGSEGIAAFQDEISEYKSAKGSVQFPLDKPVPYELVSRIVKYRVATSIKAAEEKIDRERMKKEELKKEKLNKKKLEQQK